MPFLVKKFRFQFSVRALLAATAVLGALLGLVGNEVNRLRLHRQAERRVHELGGWYGSVTGDRYGGSWGPSWFPIIHDNLYGDFEYVWFNSTANAGLRDEDLAILKHLPRLKDLQISAPLISDEAMVHVEGIDSLRELTLYQTRVTSRGLRRLGGIRLEKLVLAGPAVTDETLEVLEAFPALRKLMISESSVTDVGLAELEHVPNLEKLILNESPIGDSGMNHLTKLTRLYELELRGLATTDGGIIPLAALERLRFLNVAQTHVTEAGLLAFRNCRTLKYLYIGEQSSSAALQTLTSALPNCQVMDSSGIRCSQGW
jgi:hypothetical protein